jgi:hypothetical protein
MKNVIKHPFRWVAIIWTLLIYTNICFADRAGKQMEYCIYNGDDPACNGSGLGQSSSGGNSGGSFFGDMMGKAALDYLQSQARAGLERRNEYAKLRIPSKAKYSRAKQLLNGQTLYLKDSSPIWFDPNGNAASIGKSGTAYSFKWFVKANMVCMGQSKADVNCMHFVFKKKYASIQTNSGQLFDTFQLYEEDMENLSTLTKY